MKPLKVSVKPARKNSTRELLVAVFRLSDDVNGKSFLSQFELEDVDKKDVRFLEGEYGKFLKMVQRASEEAYEELMSDEPEISFIFTRNGEDDFNNVNYEHGNILTKFASTFPPVKAYAEDGVVYLRNN